MNLDFQTIGKVEKDGVLYHAQRACVEGNGRFWAAWRYSKQVRADVERLEVEVPDADLSSVVRVNREIIDGKVLWFAYRLLPVDGTLPLGVFKDSFVLRDTQGLLPFQVPAVHALCNALTNHGSAADGSDTGIGKTFHALGVCRNMIVRPAVVCRKAGVAGWLRACKQMGVEPLFVTNWENAKNGQFQFAERTARGNSWRYRWKLPGGVILIFDEAHMGAVDGTQNNLLWLASKNIPSLSLSATFSDRAVRLRSLLWILGAVSGRADFDRWLTLRGHFVNQYNALESLDDMSDLLEINRVLYPRHGARLSYADPEVKRYFPDAVYQTEIISLSRQETERQNTLYHELIGKVEYYRALGKQAEALTADLRYRQATELLKAPTVAEMARNYVGQGLSVLVFVNFRETLAWFMKTFDTRMAIFGDQERFNIDREMVIDKFQKNEARLIFLMEQAGGQSISLHDLDGRHPRISLIFPTYDPIVLQQLLGRTYRANVRSTPVMKLVYAAGTVEEKVADNVSRKLRNISALNNGDLMEPDLFKLGTERVGV
jgi:hypothetical protein